MQDSRQQLGRRLRRRHGLDERCYARYILGQLGAGAASRQMTFEGSPLLTAESPIHVVAQQDFQLSARHTRTLCRRSTRANSALPRFNRDFTVPSGTLSTCAISRYSNSSRSLRITVSRSSGDSFCKPACRTSLASLPASIPSVLASIAVVSSRTFTWSSIDSVARSIRVRR